MGYKVLDLFCGAGGAARGLDEAMDCDILGIDINPMPRYPYNFQQMDALEALEKYGSQADFIWASPPCQRYSKATAQQRNKGVEYPDLIAPTRELLKKIGKSYCIENVMSAPLQHPIRLCGQMFGLRLLRHRIFESNFLITEPPHTVHTKLQRGVDKDYICAVSNAYKKSEHKDDLKAVWQEALGIDWMTKKEMSESVPPAYSEYIANQWLLSEYVKT